MKLKITSIEDKGDLKKERIVMKAFSDGDVGEYAILETGYSQSGVNTDTRDCFWFPDKDVEDGDLVVLYTKVGRNNEKTLGSGRHSRFFYWGRDSAKWKKGDRAPVLLHVASWQSLSPED